MKKPLKLRPIKPDYEGMQLVVGPYGNVSEIIDWVNSNNSMARYMCAGTEHPCDKLEHWLEVYAEGRGWIRLQPGDWVVKLEDSVFEVQLPEQIERTCLILPLDYNEPSESEEMEPTE